MQKDYEIYEVKAHRRVKNIKELKGKDINQEKPGIKDRFTNFREMHKG
jgi:hypothetical protein